MLVEAHSCQLFGLFALMSLPSQAWMRLDHEQLAKGIYILVEFPCRLEIFEVDMFRVNGLVFSKRPDFLHFKLYK